MIELVGLTALFLVSMGILGHFLYNKWLDSFDGAYHQATQPT